MPGTRTDVCLSFYCTTNNPRTPYHQGNTEVFALFGTFLKDVDRRTLKYQLPIASFMWNTDMRCDKYQKLFNYAPNFKIEKI